MDPVKVAGITEWPTPMKKKEVQFFLGFTNFYCHFIEGFSHHTKPLFKLTKKDWKWHCEEDKQWAFNKLKKCITLSPILRFADDSKAFHVEADSLDYATGAVLSQQSSDNLKWHPVTPWSQHWGQHNYISNMSGNHMVYHDLYYLIEGHSL